MRKTLILPAIALGMTTVFFSGCVFPHSKEYATSGDVSQSTTESEYIPPVNSEKCAPADNFIAALLNAKSFKIETSGNVDSGGIADQVINTQKMKDQDSYYYYTKTVSSNPLVSDSILYSYFTGNTVAYNEGTREITSVTESNTKVESRSKYVSVYGTTPMDHTIEGILITDNTLENVSSKANADGSTTYTLTMKNCNEAAQLVRVHMKKTAGLNKVPDFKSITIWITVDKDGKPLTSDLECNYIAEKVIFKPNCKQKLHSTYTIDGSVTIPNQDKYVSIINK